MSDYKPLTVTISLAVQQKLRAEAKKRGMKLKYLVEEALAAYLKQKAA